MKDKDGKPLAVGDAVMVSNPRGSVPKDIPFAGLVSKTIPHRACFSCGQATWAIFAGDRTTKYCGCALTKLDGSGVEEDVREEAAA